MVRIRLGRMLLATLVVAATLVTGAPAEAQAQAPRIWMPGAGDPVVDGEHMVVWLLDAPGSGQATYSVYQCEASEEPTLADCDPSTEELFEWLDLDGGYSSGQDTKRELTLDRQGSRRIDCVVTPCQLVAVASDGAVVATAPYTVLAPELQVQISPLVTLREGTDVAVIRLDVTCPRRHFYWLSTPASVSATIAGSGATETTVVMEGRQCEGVVPIPFYLVTRGAGANAPALGPADVSVSVSASTTFNPRLAQPPHRASVQVVDEAAVADAIREQLQGPDGAELQWELQKSILERIEQDPPFYAEFLAALRG